MPDRVCTPEYPQGLYVEAVYRDDEHGCTSYQVVGGQKRYLRKWDSGKVEWGWVLSEKAVRTE